MRFYLFNLFFNDEMKVEDEDKKRWLTWGEEKNKKSRNR